jgi:hypothetical protein
MKKDELKLHLDGFIKEMKDEFNNMQYCQTKGYVTPMEWIEKHKHF